MGNLELLLEEYKVNVSIGEKYFDRMYATLNFTMIFYGAVLTVMYGTTRNAPTGLVFGYLLPVGTYIMGLFYAYNSFVIARQGFMAIILEDLIKDYSEKKYGEISFVGWNILSKSTKYNGDYILPYGTSLMFFILAPVFDLLIVLRESSFRVFIRSAMNSVNDFIISILPVLFYFTYLIFMIRIIINIVKLYFEIKQIQIYAH